MEASCWCHVIGYTFQLAAWAELYVPFQTLLQNNSERDTLQYAFIINDKEIKQH